MTMPMNIQGRSATPADEPVSVELTEAQIWELLKDVRFARLGTIGEDGFAHITPLNIVSDGERIFFRTAQGSKLLQLTLDANVTIQADRVEGSRAHSINVFCRARQLVDSEEIAYVETLNLAPWLDTVKLEVVELTPVTMTGRRFRLG